MPSSSLRTKLRILLADDHAVVRTGLKMLVDSQPDMEVIAEAASGRAAVQKAVQFRPDIVVIDISMPLVPGPDATRQIKQSAPGVEILALSVHEDKSYLREMLDAGATGYVLKRSAADDLIRAIHIVAHGGMYLDPALAVRVVSDLTRAPKKKNRVRFDDIGGDLSVREVDVLHRIAQGYSNKEIAEQLTLSVKTVETYKARSMEKLSLDSSVDIMRYAVQQGWLNDEGNDGRKDITDGSDNQAFFNSVD